MSKYQRGDVVILPFPFSGSPGDKVRPALILAEVPFAGRMDYAVCIISTQNAPDPNIIELDPPDVQSSVQGRVLLKKSYLRPAYLYTTGESRINRKVGVMRREVLEAALTVLADLFKL